MGVSFEAILFLVPSLKQGNSYPEINDYIGVRRNDEATYSMKNFPGNKVLYHPRFFNPNLIMRPQFRPSIIPPQRKYNLLFEPFRATYPSKYKKLNYIFSNNGNKNMLW